MTNLSIKAGFLSPAFCRFKWQTRVIAQIMLDVKKKIKIKY